MDTQQKDLSYFSLRLQELLHTSFPENAYNQKFIKQRSSLAANAYEEAFHAGSPIEQGNEVEKEGQIKPHFLNFDIFDTKIFSILQAV
ncbi:MAG TPA: DUF1896 family protein [Ginsengibacter sp.]|nr:DUF1896 family protein [Ginsengibacter sp.]